MAEIRPTYLVCVSGQANSNKYYNMFPEANSFRVEYGRVDVSKTEVSYPMSDWNKKYNEKIKKGYKDVTDLKTALVEEVSAKNPDKTMKQIENESVRKIIEYLRSIARDLVQKNYTVKSSSVTLEMVESAQDELDDLVKAKHSVTVDGFNNCLLRIFTIIPRRMGNVRDYLASDRNEFDKILTREQDLLDAMRGQIYVPTKKEETTEETANSDMTLLDEMGITMREATPDEILEIKKAMGESAHKFSRAWRVENKETQRRFDKFISDNNIRKTKLLFHGSRSENWFSILKTGLKIRPSNAVYTGSMFGNAVYFSPKCQKSIGYTSLSGSYWASGSDNKAYMALMNVAYGNPYDVYSFDSKYYSMNYDRLPRGTNCLHAHAGQGMLRNDEIVIYREDQCTIKYLIEIHN